MGEVVLQAFFYDSSLSDEEDFWFNKFQCMHSAVGLLRVWKTHPRASNTAYTTKTTEGSRVRRGSLFNFHAGFAEGIDESTVFPLPHQVVPVKGGAL
jgi:hypothetical protein